MVGLGESTEELIEVFRDLGTRGVDILTVGQYLRPSKDHLPIARFYEPQEFVHLRDQALPLGSAMWSPGRWCVPAITRTNTPTRRRQRRRCRSLRRTGLSVRILPNSTGEVSIPIEQVGKWHLAAARPPQC